MLIFTSKFIKKEITKKVVFILIFVFIFDYVLFPTPILAREVTAPGDIVESILGSAGYYEDEFKGSLPQSENLKVVSTSYHAVSAYNSLVAQCDASPCITANGFNVCEHGVEDTIAANFLRFGTKVRMPELFGDRVFIVRDRMNKRYPNRIDIWMVYKSDARQFGVKNVKIEVLK